jgi:Tfp pilus assembly protein PilV
MLTKITQSGQSLLEAVVAIGVVTVVLSALIAAISFSLANTQYSRNKAQATKYGQEAIEWLRSQRDAGWATFVSKAGAAACESHIYCLNGLTVFPAAGACAAGAVFNAIFTRTATLTYQSADQVGVNVTVSWPQGNRNSNITLDTFLTNWHPVSSASPNTSCLSGLPYGVVSLIAPFPATTCQDECGNQGFPGNCISIGTDNNGSNGYYYVDFASACSQRLGSCSQPIFYQPAGRICATKLTEWTNCRCQ